ncbi:SMI1/KNR4 family protein [Paenibacillus periandrae]|uniref:SMI1/KNR4 family protein n=1 Tax=Paenibacillus periandrae TaxID=1761741 RepID=UPI001F08F987|nr:SMI1/KNR4 family protein [Paenibacillus periandrae]
MHIVWNFPGEMITRGEVIELEKKLNVKFPEDYISQILVNNGGIPDPSQLDFYGRKGKTLGELFCINDVGSANIHKMYNGSRDVLPMSIVPIAADAGGNYYCFDYINGADPSIVYWNQDECYPADDVTPEQLKTKPLEAWQREAITPACNTFTELLQMLY